MAGWISDDKKRNIIPRWRDFKQTILLGELTPTKNIHLKVPSYPDPHQRKINDWKMDKSVRNAIELLNSSYILDDDASFLESSSYLEENPKFNSASISLITGKNLHPNNNSNHSEQFENIDHLESIIGILIKNLRSNIRYNPHNSISWIELARLYLIIGKEHAAERCILVGIQLSPHNRYVSRIAARFFAHTGDFKMAKNILKSNMAFNSDPWLIGADIGISSLQNKSSNHIKKAQKLVESKNYSFFELNELLSALATEELNSGSIKNSRKLFNQSLISPNDNTLAQAVWANRHINNINIYENSFEKIPNIFEAKAYKHFNLKEWGSSMSNALQWFIDQPFSREPASFGSFIACTVLERYEEAIKLCNYGLKATPNDFTLMNNLAFSLLKTNDINRAHLVIQKIHGDSLPEQHRIVYLATKGFLMYKLNQVSYGAQLYKESSSLAGKAKNKKLQLLSEFHHLSVQLEHEGFPSNKLLKIEKISSELEDLNEVYLEDLIKNLKRRLIDYREAH